MAPAPSRRATSTWPRPSQVGLRRRGGVLVRRPRLLLPGSIYGFNVEASRPAQQLAAKRGVPLHLHAVIYQLIQQLRAELSAKLPPLSSQSVLGRRRCEAALQRAPDL